VRILSVRRNYRQVIVHDAGLTRNLPPQLVVSLFCSKNRGKFRKPENLSIVLVHNRPNKTLMELSLDYVGIENYTVLRTPAAEPWRHTTRITEILRWFRSGACTTEYVLCADCDDALMNDDPARAVQLLQEAGCDLLVSSSSYTLYRNMPEARRATEAIAPPERRVGLKPNIHLNAGVYISTAKFLREYLEMASAYVTSADLQSHELLGMSDADLLHMLPEFPRGFGSDQAIMRYLFPRLYPRMKIDYDARLVER
jgi:hypothetical protein